MAEAFKQRAATGRIAEMFEGLSSELKPLPAYERVGLSERLKALDDVGNCLSKG